MNHIPGLKILDEMTASLVEKARAISDPRWQELIRECYLQFHVMDENGQWTLPSLAHYHFSLIPENFGGRQIEALILHTNEALKENEYFLNFMDVIDGHVPEIRDDHLAHLLIFAFCLEQLNRLQRRDLNVLDKMIRHYWKTRRENNFYRLSNILAVIKLHSIELPVVLFLRARRKNKISPSFAKFILSFNIFEATMVDFCVGNIDNAISTFPLIQYPPNHAKGGPSHFTQDGLALNLVSPRPRQWADLYQVWNMAFVIQFPQAPYLLTKLLIPSVSQYANRPVEYMHTRITALHLAMNYLDSAMQAPKIKIDLKNLGPATKPLIKLWGKVNRMCGVLYKRKVNGTTRTD